MPLRPITASDWSNASAASLPAMPFSRATTSRGVVRSERLSPEPSTTFGAMSNCASVSRTTFAPAAVEPAVPNSAPRPLISVSAL